ncbi:acyltransferase family protein [Streptomyces sp. WM6378]|uniref:acyltransferase family protein n=1 Tax=Streptomyces sp. WM6378 TaxID=1415557 RepID=UPI0006AFEA63|nr:acyltransferase [Streptomyces sp. WM6378]KOU43960.1 acyltransferase [Streptomyces sp. WM6378]
MRELIQRIEEATPAGRDRAVDALRAFAILGVVLGHWLVTALVFDSGTVHGASPLQHMPQLAPISWVFQTLAVFFLVGGQVATKSYASARARGVTYGQWLRARLGRLFRPVAAVLVVWLVAAGGMLASGVGLDTLHTLFKLVLSPLWFLLVFAALTAATPLVSRVHPLWPLAVVMYVDVYRFGNGGAQWTGWLNLPAGWLVPYCLGALWARRGAGTSLRTTGWVLLVGGSVVTALLVLFAGYPASMVGVPGAAISNLNPPTLAAVTFGLAQCGAALLLLGPLRRALRRPTLWAAVALVNLSAMTIFLWHQTSMIAVTCLGLLAGGDLAGLHTVPDGSAWVLARLAWLPVFAVMLVVCWVTFRAYEQPRRGRGGSRVVRAGRPARTGEMGRA